MLCVEGRPRPEVTGRIADSKRVIFEGLRQAVRDGAPLVSAAMLVDEEFGAEVARAAMAEGFTVAMPVEKSGQDEFDFEYGADFGRHIEAFDPTFAKALVRYNPDGDAAMNRRQLARLAELSSWLHEHGRRFLIELLVPPEPAQLDAAHGDRDRYDVDVRPALTIQTIAESQAAGVEPDIWKVEGMDRRQDCQRVVDQARTGGREQVSCIILGGGASVATDERWLREAAGVLGFIGFAIGRTIWREPLQQWLADNLDRTGASRSIADNYRRMVDTYERARASSPATNLAALGLST